MSNERYENSAVYGLFRFLIFILIFNKNTILYNAEFSYLSFETGLSSELAKTTTFSRKNENWHD